MWVYEVGVGMTGCGLVVLGFLMQPRNTSSTTDFSSTSRSTVSSKASPTSDIYICHN